MSQEPVTVTYSLEEVLGEIKQSIKELNQKFDRFDERLARLETGQARIEEKIEGVSKRLENQEFIARSVMVGLILAFLAGLAKLFGLIPPSS
jgi:hypothetical protein